MKSPHTFSQVPSAKIPRSSFNLSHSHKCTFDADLLIPICQPIDIIPGDTFNMKTNFFIRLNTMLRPILDNMRFETFAFFVPSRTVWDDFEHMHGAEDEPGDSIDFTVPQVSSNSAARTAVGSLWDYWGLPIGVIADNLTEVSSLPYRSYEKIWSEWFRDENLQNRYVYATDAGPDVLNASLKTNIYITSLPLPRGKRKDYFTSALPWPQKGTAVSMPLGNTAPIFTLALDGESVGINDAQEAAGIFHAMDTDGTAGGHVVIDDPSVADAGLFANLADATAATINDIRLAFQTQRLLERDARAGTRYVETLKAHWGVTSPDMRLQRAEFLGGGSSIINLSTVMQNSAQGTPTETDKVGNLAANGTVSGTHSWTKSFVEHGLVIILGNVRGDITYSQGVDRYWLKNSRYDFFYPVLAGIGEQSITNVEIFVTGTGTPATDDAVFGYQERYSEYRYLNSKICGLLRPADAGGGALSGTLASWHLSEQFTSLPTLGDTFIQANTRVPLDRAIAVPSQPQFYADFWHEIKAARPLPLYGVPGNIDHF